ncbi:hypothetical protein L1049_028365 [Liquidambar formosana]|uniref:Uncharacterized protein n=1 Tax=Liquidambar formosana TaxID=63359 RepID=A0AAP0RIU8_LIQFO
MSLGQCRGVCYKKDNKMPGFNLQRRRRGGRRACRSVRMKVQKLQRLVPGGHGLQPDKLYLQTAEYILHLRLQLNVLEAILKVQEP